MRLLDGVFEFDTLSLDLEQRAGLLLVQRLAQVVFKGGHLRQQMMDSVIHKAP